jgi:hypothetical protein
MTLVKEITLIDFQTYLTLNVESISSNDPIAYILILTKTEVADLFMIDGYCRRYKLELIVNRSQSVSSIIN